MDSVDRRVFRDLRPDDRGVLRRLLERSYEPLKTLNEYPWIPSDDIWRRYDDDVFDTLGETDQTVFMTELEGSIVGFASFTHAEAAATIGRNSVLPEYWGRGVGTAQVKEVIRRCEGSGVTAIHVVTGSHRFFARAQRMYLKCGFNEVSRDDDGNGVGRILIRYRLDI